MTDSVKNGILIAVAALTIINTGMILTSDSGVSYEKTSVTTPNQNNAANNQTMSQDNFDNEATLPPQNTGPKTSIEFTETEYDFGTIDQNTSNPKVFTFKNTGSEPLIISDAKGSCGCTVPRYPREPIAPGETGEIEVVYSPGNQKNQQTKTVTIVANTDPETTVLRVTANVNEVEGSDGNQPTLQMGS
tara:strand:- start:902 stop:1468 length:567 start_codon:yes stop_codon:yes gene_type:complete